MGGDVRWWSVFVERIILCWVLVCLVFAWGSSEIGGTIGSSGLSLTRDGNPYVVRLDLDVAEDGVLSIESGVEMHFMPGVGINVKGQLHANVSPYSSMIHDSATSSLMGCAIREKGRTARVTPFGRVFASGLG